MKYLSKLIREIVPVIIGILIALFINNWNEDRKDKEYLDQIFSSMEKELEESLADIRRVLPKQLASIDTLDVYLNNEEVSLYAIMMRSNGIHFPSIKTNSWNAIVNSKIELIEYDKLSALADFEEGKENLKFRVEKQMDYIFQNFEKKDVKKKTILRMMLVDIVSAEKGLCTEIEAILKK
ncbi:MAG: DUF6090 family protein [Saprospiraceae bacterium]